MFAPATLLLLPFAVASVLPSIVERDDTPCTDVHLFLARGNGEAYPGRVGQVANFVCQGLASCDSENIQFVSTAVYCDQVAEGASSGVQQINAYAARCPNTRLVLGGYSLGAQIVGDILGGGGGDFYGCTERTVAGLGSSSTGAGAHIAAALLFGDVRHDANQVYNVGTGSASDGQYPRSGDQLTAMNAYSTKLRSYCLSQDPICANGNDGNSHTTYMEVYGSAAADWVHQILGGKSASSSSAGGSSSSSGSAGSSGSSSSVKSNVLVSTTTSSPSGSSASGTASSSASGSTVTGVSSDSESSSTDSTASSGAMATATSTSDSDSTATMTGSASRNTATFTPFVFADSATAATTSTYTPTSYSQSFTIMSSSLPPVATPTSSFTSLSSTSSRAAAYSQAGAYANKAPYTISLVTLVVLKVLAF